MVYNIEVMESYPVKESITCIDRDGNIRGMRSKYPINQRIDQSILIIQKIEREYVGGIQRTTIKVNSIFMDVSCGKCGDVRQITCKCGIKDWIKLDLGNKRLDYAKCDKDSGSFHASIKCQCNEVINVEVLEFELPLLMSDEDVDKAAMISGPASINVEDGRLVSINLRDTLSTSQFKVRAKGDGFRLIERGVSFEICEIVFSQIRKKKIKDPR